MMLDLGRGNVWLLWVFVMDMWRLVERGGVGGRMVLGMGVGGWRGSGTVLGRLVDEVIGEVVDDVVDGWKVTLMGVEKRVLSRWMVVCGMVGVA